MSNEKIWAIAAVCILAAGILFYACETRDDNTTKNKSSEPVMFHAFPGAF